MTSQPAQRASGASTTGFVLGVLAVVLMLVALGTHSGIAVLGGLVLGVAGLVLGIVARRESAITLSAVAVLGTLAIGFGVLG